MVRVGVDTLREGDDDYRRHVNMSEVGKNRETG